MNENIEHVSIHNPEKQYIPSGKVAHCTFRTYVLFAVIAAAVIQIPFGITEGLLAVLVRFSSLSGIWLFLSSISLGGIGFLITGCILSYLISVGTKLGHCRNPKAAKVTTVVTIGLSLICRPLVTFIFTGSVLDLPAPYWIETLLGFGVVLFGALFFVPEMKPYCETCGQYMRRQQYLFAPSDQNRILSELSESTLQGHDHLHCREWKRTKDLFPSVQVVLHVCEQCQGGFVKVESNTITIDKKNVQQRSSKSVYSDQCEPSVMMDLSKSMHDSYQTNA